MYSLNTEAKITRPLWLCIARNALSSDHSTADVLPALIRLEDYQLATLNTTDLQFSKAIKHHARFMDLLESVFERYRVSCPHLDRTGSQLLDIAEVCPLRLRSRLMLRRATWGRRSDSAQSSGRRSDCFSRVHVCCGRTCATIGIQRWNGMHRVLEMRGQAECWCFVQIASLNPRRLRRISNAKNCRRRPVLLSFK